MSISGCSSIYVKHPVALKPDKKLGITWCIHSSSEMNVVDGALSTDQNQVAFDERISQAINDIDLRFHSQRVNSNELTYRKLAQCTDPTTENDTSSLYLTLELSGYGSIKRKWRVVLIGTGAVEALFQGILVSAATDNPWLGVAVAAEEMTSEYLTWNGIDWIFGETYAPVTLEGILSYRNNIIWHDSYFVTENEDEIAKDERDDKSKQLIASLHQAEQKLLSSLSNYIHAEILEISPGHVEQPDDDY